MTATVGEAPPATVVRRVRGKSKKPNWRYDGPLSVIALDLDLSGDPRTRRRIEQQFTAAYRLERALKRDAADRCRAYWAATHERGRDPKAVRERLGLDRRGLESAAYRHIDSAVWMRDHLTKALGCHTAGRIWEATKRHLFGDASGKRLGVPHPGSWWQFTTLTGRARSHTKTIRVWETWRLAGTLDGHLQAYGNADTLDDALALPHGASVFTQPAVLPAPVRPPKNLRSRGWWDHQGALTVVFTGLPGGDIAMPVRLPSGRGKLDRLAHFLGDPSRWHKIDLVRVRDRNAAGGWRYQAHLTILAPGYQSPSTIERHAEVPGDRLAGLDANVSNLAAVSMFSSTRRALDSLDDALRVEHVRPTVEQEQRAKIEALHTRRRQRHLERSRRAANRDQYGLSKRQNKRAARRAARDLPEKMVEVPQGPRHGDAAGRPRRSYRTDTLSKEYRDTRAELAMRASATAARKDAVARDIAARLVTVHGNRWVTEGIDMRSWMRLWGKRMAVTTPGRIVAAIRREVETTGGSWRVAGTRNTAMSQHCLCGRREKKPLNQRRHCCPDCLLEADRDILAAALAACVVFTDPDQPSTARVDPTLSAVIARRLDAQQEGRLRSTIAYRETGSAGGSNPHNGKAPAGENDSPGPPRNRKPTPTRWEQGRRRRNSQTHSSGGSPPGN